MKKGDENRFIGGPWPHTAGYEIKYSLNGQVKSEYRKDKVEAENRAQYWQAYFQDPASASKIARQKETTVQYWDRLLRNHAESLVRDPDNKTLIAAARALSSLASEGIKCAKMQTVPDTEKDHLEDVDYDTLSAEELGALLQAGN